MHSTHLQEQLVTCVICRVREEDAAVLRTLLGMKEEEHRDVNAVWPQHWVDIQSLITIHCIYRDVKGEW